MSKQLSDKGILMRLRGNKISLAASLLLAGAALAVAPALSLAASKASKGDSTATTTTSPAAIPRAKATHGVVLDRVVAVVNDGVVLQSELDAQVHEFTQRLAAQNVNLPPANVLRDQVLERLVLEEIQAQHAQKAGIVVSDEQLNAALEHMAQAQNIPFSQLPEKLGAAGYVYSDFRSGIRKQMQREMLQQRDVLQRINISPRELDQYLEKQKHTVNAANEYNISHILVAVAQDADAATMVAARKKIQDIANRIAAGEAFSQLAVTYSDSQTALEGGSLGWLKPQAIPTFLADVVGRLKPGETTAILQTASGFHIARLNELRTGSGPQMVEQAHIRHILLKTSEVLDDATVEQKLLDMRRRIVAGEDFAVLAAANSQDPGSAVQGGDLGWSETSVYVGEFAAQAAKLKENEISMPFRSAFGWHLMQLLGRRTIDNSENLARDQAYGQLRASRADEATELWLQQLRDESYVELKP
jgi:peptidyl-prolyl cis-trans isomerase SurA